MVRIFIRLGEKTVARDALTAQRRMFDMLFNAPKKMRYKSQEEAAKISMSSSSMVRLRARTLFVVVIRIVYIIE